VWLIIFGFMRFVLERVNAICMLGAHKGSLNVTALATTSNARSRQEWVEIIGADWRRTAESIIQTGRDLTAAKAELAHGEFMKMIENDLPFHRNTAEGLMRASQNEGLINCINSGNLAPKLSVIIQLSALNDEEAADAEEKGLITPDLKVKAARAIVGAYHKPEGEIIGGARHMLPSPEEARKIARAKGRLVAASDGYTYSGATREEERSYADKRTAAFRIIEAIQLLSEAPDASAWFRSAERRWFLDFRPGAIDDAREWLAALKSEMGVVDA
jgi:hypothetical protein